MSRKWAKSFVFVCSFDFLFLHEDGIKERFFFFFFFFFFFAELLNKLKMTLGRKMMTPKIEITMTQLLIIIKMLKEWTLLTDLHEGSRNQRRRLRY